MREGQAEFAVAIDFVIGSVGASIRQHVADVARKVRVLESLVCCDHRSTHSSLPGSVPGSNSGHAALVAYVVIRLTSAH